MKTLSTVLAASMLLSLAACGGKAEEVLHDIGTNPAKAEAKSSYASGAWVSSCQTLTGIDIGAPIQSFNTVDTMTLGQMNRVRTFYAKPDCTDKNMMVNENIQFSFGDNTVGDNWAYDQTITATQAVALTDDIANKLTTLGYCDMPKWEANKPQVVTNVAGTEARKCFGTNKTGVTQFGVVQVTGPGQNKVYYSNLVDDRNVRPKTADASSTAVVYTRP